MKRITLCAAVAVVMVALSSCQKETGSNNPLPAQSLKIKTYTVDVRSSIFGNVATTYNLSYDANDKLIKMVDASNPGSKFTYAYPSSAKYTLDLFINNAFELHVDFLLNSHSLIDSSIQYNNTNDTTTEKYVYNSANQLTKLYEYERYSSSYLSNTTSYTYDGAGNLVKAVDTFQDVYTYEYYDDKLYVLPQVIPVTVPGEKVNLLKKVTLSANGTLLESYTCTYTFDSKDRISIERNDYNDGDVVIKTYTYFD